MNSRLLVLVKFIDLAMMMLRLILVVISLCVNITVYIHLEAAARELPGDDIVIVEKSASFTNDAEHSFQLQECGLSLDFPKGMITAPVESAPVGYDVTVKGLWGGKFVFPEGTQLISSVTSVSLTVPSSLDKPVTVQLMHCAGITDQSQSKYLSFVISHSAQPPFVFELLQGGDFPVGSQYGTIQLKEFSWIAIVLIVSVTATIAAVIGCKLSFKQFYNCF